MNVYMLMKLLGRESMVTSQRTSTEPASKIVPLQLETRYTISCS